MRAGGQSAGRRTCPRKGSPRLAVVDVREAPGPPGRCAAASGQKPVAWPRGREGASVLRRSCRSSPLPPGLRGGRPAAARIPAERSGPACAGRLLGSVPGVGGKASEASSLAALRSSARLDCLWMQDVGEAGAARRGKMSTQLRGLGAQRQGWRGEPVLLPFSEFSGSSIRYSSLIHITAIKRVGKGGKSNGRYLHLKFTLLGFRTCYHNIYSKIPLGTRLVQILLTALWYR